MATVTLAARTLLALVFATAAITKLPRPSASRATFEGFGVGERLARIGALALAPVELAVAAALMFVPTARWGAAGAAFLLLVFIGGISTALRNGRRPDCGCFGAFRPTPIGQSTLVRNGALLAVSAIILVAGPGPAADRWLSSHSAVSIASALVLVAAAFAAFIYRSPGLNADAAERFEVNMSPLLRAGDEGPAFELSDGGAELRTLESLYAPGQPLVLVFGSTGCGACMSLFPHIARWQSSLGERLRIALVLAGDSAAARSVTDEYGIVDVLADGDGAVFRAYGIHTSPSAFALGPEGRVASGPAIAGDSIEDLIRLTLHRDAPIPRAWLQTTSVA